uniref:HAUS augmin-like complex subunit 6 N-terminal domain-containing protein n=1 Tax=Phlebotomus papatasi TaxID=29031 RepID=A0A1B0EXY8_PHLPP
MAEGGRSVKNLRLEEEQRLSNAVFFGLYALTQAHKPTAEFQKVFQKDLFLKPNAGALPHVMHYLLTIYDAEEFRKRFHWPIYNDRDAEKSFRSNCLKYLMELNDRFQLKLEDLSTYMMLFPGGLKFLKVMEKLMIFVITEDMKKKNQLDILESMTIAKSNRIIQKLTEEREAINKIADDTL